MKQTIPNNDQMIDIAEAIMESIRDIARAEIMFDHDESHESVHEQLKNAAKKMMSISQYEDYVKEHLPLMAIMVDINYKLGKEIKSYLKCKCDTAGVN